MDEVGAAELLAAAGTGRVLVCGDGGTSRRVDAALLRRCCHELRDQIDPRGIWLQHAAIAGSVDLAGLEVSFPLRFDGCHFDAPLLAEGARLSGLVLTGCALPGLQANGVRIQRDLDLSRTHVTGALRTSASTSKHRWAACTPGPGWAAPRSARRGCRWARR